jgi:anti-anti-sigma factor
MTDESRPAHDALTPPQAFRLEEVSGPEGICVLEMAGEIDLSTSGRFREFVDGALGRDVKALVVDLAEVTFMDSTMLRELLRAVRDLQAAGGRLVLVSVGPTVRRLLDMTGTAELFVITATREEATSQAG